SQLLRGDGHGRFTAVPPGESNLIVPGDAKALAMLDFNADGWPDFLVTRNNATTLAFRNNGVAGRHSLGVRLRGPSGNPTAVGARITVEFADGSKRASEVYAGSGYYSQSTAACFVGWLENNPPRKVQVRWPSGIETAHAVSSPSPVLIVSAPGL
ncbi:MAG TPA: CRTAC1 family protein, partial [Opitutaceae bacterium]|nr:CRTAC1 family protein [Opitutaceae bacterium]